MNKILILSCGTGGGHNSAAKAIQENLIEKGLRADFVEYLDIINPKIKDSVNNLYLKSTGKEGQVFKHIYRLGELYEKTRIKSPVYGLNTFGKKKLYNYIIENEYDYVVTTHLFAAEALTAIKKEHDIHFIAVATDYVCIPFWEETNPDYFVIPHKDLEHDFLNKGIEAKKLLAFGIPVAKTYRESYNKDMCKAELGLEQNKNYALILTGSMGFGNVTQMIKELLEQISNITFIISCGNNISLLEEVKKIYKDDNRIISIPYTNELSKYMKSSDIILSKPGGLTTTEIATLHKPFIHTMPIPGCENYNANFFCTRNMSIKCETIQEIIDNMKQLLSDENLQKEMMENQAKYINKNVCDDISNFIIHELKGNNK